MFYNGRLHWSTMCCFCLCHVFVNAWFLMFKILDHACVSEKYGVLSMKCFTLISLLNYSSFLRFITVVFVTWERLGLINFLLHIAYWFHLWLFNIVHVQYGFFLKICFFLGQIDNLSFAQNGQIIKPVLKFKFWRHACVNAEYVVFSMKRFTSIA